MAQPKILRENYTNAAEHTLISKNSRWTGNIRKITISNNSANPATGVHVHIHDGTTTYYYCKNVTIPSGVTLVLNDNLAFNHELFDLKVTNAGTSPDITVIIK
tara:strand:- start:31 stop:339 length:309 start_codon:yes stop_codon:yes gene_type:complete